MGIVIKLLAGCAGAALIVRGARAKRRHGKWRAAVFCGGFLLAAAVFAVLLPRILFPEYESPAVTGEYAVATAEYTWVDESRIETYTDTGEKRRLTVKIWYPVEPEMSEQNTDALPEQAEMSEQNTDALPEHSCPLVVFSHGAFGVIDSNYSTCTELASHGYVVASIGHTYHAMFVTDTDGNTTYASTEFLKQVSAGNSEADDPESEKERYEYSREWMQVRTADENFVLDQILSLAAGTRKENTHGEMTGTGAEGAAEDVNPWRLIDTEHIGLFGHSMGGAASVQLGRERDDIDAVIDLEGTMLGEYVDFADGTEVFNEEPYPVPVLDVNSAAVDAEARTLPGNGYVNFYVGERAVDYHYAVIADAGHLNFTDLPLISPILAKLLGVGDADAKECIEEVNALVLDFFDTYLKEAPEK